MNPYSLFICSLLLPHSYLCVTTLNYFLSLLCLFHGIQILARICICIQSTDFSRYLHTYLHCIFLFAFLTRMGNMRIQNLTYWKTIKTQVKVKKKYKIKSRFNKRLMMFNHYMAIEHFQNLLHIYPARVCSYRLYLLLLNQKQTDAIQQMIT